MDPRELKELADAHHQQSAATVERLKEFYMQELSDRIRQRATFGDYTYRFEYVDAMPNSPHSVAIRHVLKHIGVDYIISREGSVTTVEFTWG